jgi:eukaryotic-like serine/threonine-protein kinase
MVPVPEGPIVEPVQVDPLRIPGISGLSLIGQGGFSDVYRGYQDHLGRAVAVKVLRVTMVDKSAAEQFRVEARALGSLDGFDNVLRVHDAAVLPDGRPYLITELCDGSLAQLLNERGPLSVEQATAIGYKVTCGLLAAHAKGILHGDVTPRNVLLRPSGVPVLADFGMAVLRDYGITAATGRTLAHAAPEILQDDAVLTPASDVYGLGSTIYTSLAGQPPFPGRAGESTQLRVLRVWSEPPPELPPAVPASLQKLVSAMLAKEPGDRPTLTDVADQLANRTRPPRTVTTTTAMTTWSPGSAGSPGWPGSPGSPGSPGWPGSPGSGTVTDSRPFDDVTRGRAPAPSPSGGKALRRRRLLIVAVAGGMALLLGTIGVVQLTGHDPDPPRPSSVTTQSAAVPVSTPVSVSIELALPKDLGDAVELSWTGPPNVSYNVTIAPRGQPTRTELVNRATTRRVPVDPSTQYCFRIEGTDGRQAYVSNAQAIRGALCRF